MTKTVSDKFSTNDVANASKELLIAAVAQLKSRLKAYVDADDETERLKYITTGTGQAMTYQQKVAETQALGLQLVRIP